MNEKCFTFRFDIKLKSLSRLIIYLIQFGMTLNVSYGSSFGSNSTSLWTILFDNQLKGPVWNNISEFDPPLTGRINFCVFPYYIAQTPLKWTNWFCSTQIVYGLQSLCSVIPDCIYLRLWGGACSWSRLRRIEQNMMIIIIWYDNY